MATALIMMAGMGLLGAISGGLSSSQQQTDIKKQVCDTAKQTQAYSQTMQTALTEIQQADQNVRDQIKNTTINIQQSQKIIKAKQQSFKQQYNMFLIGGLVFILIVIFLLASKKFILMKAKMNNK